MEKTVRLGAWLLDEKRPGWHNEISVEMLDMEDPWLCVLGQIYGDYARGFKAVVWPASWSPEIDAERIAMLGFNEDQSLADYWVREIDARRKADPA
jgi:hypothetical protein